MLGQSDHCLEQSHACLDTLFGEYNPTLKGSANVLDAWWGDRLKVSSKKRQVGKVSSSILEQTCTWPVRSLHAASVESQAIPAARAPNT